MPDDTRAETERLHRLWDAALGHAPAEQFADDSGLSGLIAAVHAADDAPQPDPRFLARLRDDMIAARPPTSTRKTVRTNSLGLVAPAPAVLAGRPILRAALMAIAAALLIAALSGGGRWLSGSAPAPLVASAMASSVPLVATAIPTPTSLSSDETSPAATISPANAAGNH
jgi:hypothetical protein